MMERIGLIAGSGRFPVLFAETARRRGVGVVAVAHVGETDQALSGVVEAITWVHAGQLEAIIQALTQAGVTRAVMVGGIAKPRLFREFKPDARALAVVARCGTLRDDVLLRALAQELESEGILIVESTLYLQEIVPAEGVLSARPPTPEEWADIHFGFRAAKVIGQFDIGQSVVVRGSASWRSRASGNGRDHPSRGQLVNGDIVVVKACKPTQDLVSDLPAVGPETIRTIVEVRGRALAMEAGRTIVLDRPEMLALANAADIAVVAVAGQGGTK